MTTGTAICPHAIQAPDATFVDPRAGEGPGQGSQGTVKFMVVDGVAQGTVTVTESSPPSGFRFGSLEFTPGSGDDAALVSVNNAAGVINLDTSGDADVMVHVYNFANLEGTEGGQGGPKPREGTQGGGSLPDTALSTRGTVPTGLVALAFLTALAAGSLKVAWSRKRMR